MNILFFTHPHPNFVPDLLLHGLRKLLGPEVVDYPKKECLYKGILGLGVCPDDQHCPGWFPADNGLIDRADILEKVNKGYFQYVICDLRAVPFLHQELLKLPPGLVIVDGEDVPAEIPPGPYVICRRETDGSDFSIPLPMAIPEEIYQWILSYDDMVKKFSVGFMGSTMGGYREKIAATLTHHYPDALFQTSAVPSNSDPTPPGRLTRDDYYKCLQKCRIVLSLPGAGYDTFRFWENSACNSIHVSAKMPMYIPNNFVEKEHIFRFTTIDDLRQVIDRLIENNKQAEETISKRRYQLANFHFTTQRAAYFLEKVKYAFTQ